MIAVCIATYNQEAYLAQAVESVLAQECDEPIRVFIGNDASTDKTGSIGMRFMYQDQRVVYCSWPKNVGLVANTLHLYSLATEEQCAFIAMLDGDDYWTDPHKLQRQIDYLRSHPEIGLVHTGAYEEKDGKRTLLDDKAIPTGDLSEKYNLLGARQTNCTVVFRAGLLEDIPLEELKAQGFPVLDYPLYGLFSQRTQFAYLPEPTAVWRNHESVSQPASFRKQLTYRKERIRMWRWLAICHKGHFHFRWTKAFLWYIWQIFYILFA